MTLEAIRESVTQTNAESYIRQAFIALGVSASNIKSVYPSRGGFAPRPNRWCVTLYKSAGVSANRINTQSGLSGAIVSGNQVFVLLGDMGKVG